MARQLMTMEQILSVLRDTPDRLRSLTCDLTGARLHAAPEPGEWSVAASLQAFSQQRDQLLALLGDLPDQGWSRSATVLGGGKPLELTVHSYANRLARHERTQWRQVAKTVRALLD